MRIISLLFSLVLLTEVLIITTPVFAVGEFTNLGNYINGDLNGQDGWSTVWNSLQVQDKTIKNRTDVGGAAYKSLPEGVFESGIVSTRLKIDSNSFSDNQDLLGVYKGIGEEFIAVFRFGNNFDGRQNMLLLSVAGSTDTIEVGQISQDGWHEIALGWRNSDYKIRVKVDQGAWTEWFDSQTSWKQGEEIGIRIMLPAANDYGNFYLDDLKSYFGNELAATASATPSATISPVPNTEDLGVLHVVNLVANANGGTAVPADFIVHVLNSGADVLESPAPGSSAPGTTYTLPASVYTVSEDVNAAYTQSFIGDCDADGTVTIVVGDDKICTIVNTDIPPPAPVEPATGGGDVPVVVPLIGIQKIPAPLAITEVSGMVTYDYTVRNVGGAQALSDVTVSDDKCNPLILLAGDANSDGKLDPDENWKYSCTATLTETTTNTAVVTGHSDDAKLQAAIATAIATVVVGPGLPNTGAINPAFPNTGRLSPLVDIVKIPDRLTPFPFGGGNVVYVSKVTNPGKVALHDVVVYDDKCLPLTGPTGDANGDDLLDPSETWSYTCRTRIWSSENSVTMVKARANGFAALDYAFATVLVSAPSRLLKTVVALVVGGALVLSIIVWKKRLKRVRHVI